MSEQDDRPPPYWSVAGVSPAPPGYDEGMYGMNVEGASFGQPYYIPESQARVTKPSSPCKKKPLWKGSPLCCGLSWGLLVLIVLFAVAVALGVRYKVKLGRHPSEESHAGAEGDGIEGANDYQGQEDHKGHGGHEGQEDHGRDRSVGSGASNRMLVSQELDISCSNYSALCDGHRDCTLGSDELDCVRFGSDGTLRIRSSQDSSFLPVCYQGWDDTYANRTCAQLGFRKSYSSKPVISHQSVALTVNRRSSQLIQGLVNVSFSCPDQIIVSLRCVDCGKITSSPVGGSSTSSQGKWPWQVALYYRGLFVCGGSLVSPDFVVTAAHCVSNRSKSSPSKPSDWRVYAGVASRDILSHPHLVRTIIVNENYDNVTYDNDIALLKMAEPIGFSDTVQPICLPSFDMTFPQGTLCRTTGFGSTSEGAGTAFEHLVEVSAHIIDNSVCNSPTVHNGIITRNMLCAGHLTEVNNHTCQVDSGGPLVCQASDERWYLVGVAGGALGCGRGSLPGVYSSMPSLVSWAHRTMQREKP